MLMRCAGNKKYILKALIFALPALLAAQALEGFATSISGFEHHSETMAEQGEGVPDSMFRKLPPGHNKYPSLSKKWCRRSLLFFAGDNSTLAGNENEINENEIKEITDIRAVVTPYGAEKVLIWGKNIAAPAIFAIEGEKPRVVCDFRGFRLGRGISKKIKANGRMIKIIRIGLYEGEDAKVRIVLDLSPDASYDVEQTLFEKENIYELAVKPEKIIIRK